MDIDAFKRDAPAWTETATHARSFCCPACQAGPGSAESVWINRRSPVYTPDQQRNWQEFYRCRCNQVWWAWSNDRPPSTLQSTPEEPEESKESED